MSKMTYGDSQSEYLKIVHSTIGFATVGNEINSVSTNDSGGNRVSAPSGGIAYTAGLLSLTSDSTCLIQHHHVLSDAIEAQRSWLAEAEKIMNNAFPYRQRFSQDTSLLFDRDRFIRGDKYVAYIGWIFDENEKSIVKIAYGASSQSVFGVLLEFMKARIGDAFNRSLSEHFIQPRRAIATLNYHGALRAGTIQFGTALTAPLSFRTAPDAVKQCFELMHLRKVFPQIV